MNDDVDFTDNLMPNDGEPFFEDVETEDRSTEADTRREAEAEADLVLSSVPLMGHLHEWFETEIQNTDSVALAVSIAKEYDVPLEAAIVALDVCAKVLRIKQTNLKTLKEIYIDHTE